MSDQTAPSRTAAWWSQSKSRSQATAAAAIVLTAVLVGISAYVWVSPTGAPLRKAVDQATAVINPIAAQNAELKRNLDRATETIASQKGKLTALQKASLAAQAAAAKQLATAQQKASAAEGQLASVQAQLSAAQAKSASGSASAAGSHTSTGSGSNGGGSGSGSSAAPITAPSRAALVNPDKRYFGMYTEQAPFNWATFDATSAKVGVAPNMVGYFSGWDENFRANAVTRAWQQGRMPLMTWESRPIDARNDTVNAPAYSLPKIIRGDFDAYLHQYAKDIVATGLPLGIRLDHEMNGIWYPWSETDGQGNSINGNNVGDYVKMWRHVHDIFQQEGANSLVVWVWAPNIVNNLPASHKAPGYLEALYPGDAYVDWVGLSGYLRPPYKSDNDFSFDYTFKASLDKLRSIASKPIMLAEIGASETDGHKATWITSLFQSLGKPENSDIIGFSWFNLAVTSYVEGVRATNDWRIDSRADSLSAFITGLTRPEDDFVLTPAP
ncbi:glycosyl hydrolase [Leifsonia shinshuensis]|uniref:glycoside hydrolase family 26 protein n=1 Tax=Leifsonia shinshuensis TaxID=150026 RepID=UPI0028619C2C|nr:glycosyl hydrolase [Leifsonia shinshuensis]MDR6971921.1 beta-mannanase [Leifsonia shinshuensis]